jgi:hypothetical protein
MAVRCRFVLAPIPVPSQKMTPVYSTAPIPISNSLVRELMISPETHPLFPVLLVHTQFGPRSSAGGLEGIQLYIFST